MQKMEVFLNNFWKINPNETGGGRTVLIHGQTRRAMLVDKGKPL